MVQNKRSRLILDATYVTYLGTERINGTVRVLFKTRLIFSRINGPNGSIPLCPCKNVVSMTEIASTWLIRRKFAFY